MFHKNWNLYYFILSLLWVVQNPQKCTRGIEINICDLLAILFQHDYNEGTTKCQVNKHNTRFILMQTSVCVTIKIAIHGQNSLKKFTFFPDKSSKCPTFYETQIWDADATAWLNFSDMLPLFCDLCVRYFLQRVFRAVHISWAINRKPYHRPICLSSAWLYTEWFVFSGTQK